MIEKLNEEIGNRILKARLDAGLTQSVVASCLNLSRASIVNMEKGRQTVMIEHLYKIADLLDLPITAFLPDVEQIITPLELPDALKEELDKIAGSNSARMKKAIKAILNNSKG